MIGSVTSYIICQLTDHEHTQIYHVELICHLFVHNCCPDFFLVHGGLRLATYNRLGMIIISQSIIAPVIAEK